MQIVHDTPELHMERILKNFDKYKEAIKAAKTKEELDKIFADVEKDKATDELTKKQFEFLLSKLGRKYYALAKKEDE